MADVVLDLEGNPVLAGEEYYIKLLGSFHGVIRRSTPSGEQFGRPLHAALSEDDAHGQPVKFISADQTQNHIRLSSDAKIDSGFSAECQDDGKWRLGVRPIGTVVVIASGFSSTPRTWFQIRKVENNGAYRIHVATDPSFRRDVGIYPFSGPVTKVLGLVAEDGPESLHVGFIRKTTSSTT